MLRLWQMEEKLKQMIFPSLNCPACGKDTSRAGLCPDCVARLKNLPRCPKCGLLMDEGIPCRNCQNKDAGLTGAFSALPYEGLLREHILAFKFNGKSFFARPLAGILKEAYNFYYASSHFNVIVPVPLSLEHQAERGYNQVGLMGKILSRNLNLPFNPKALVRVKNTPRLYDQTAAERRVILKDCFKAEAKNIAHKHILLLDDIFTTGATAHACAFALSKAGATSVSALTVAHTPLKNSGT